MHFFIRKVYRLGLVYFIFSCQQATDNKTQTSNNAELIKTELKENDFAQGFALSEAENFTLLHIFSPFQDSNDTLQYILISKEMEVPDAYRAYARINTPVEKMVLTSTTHIAMMTHLGKIEVISAVSDPDFIYDKEVSAAIKADNIAEAGRNGQINLETILALNAGLVMSGAWSTAAFDTYTPLINAGIPVMVNAEWTEPHPLGRMEWIKVFGALLNEEAKAAALFEQSKTDYLALAKKVETANLNPPTVINGMPYQEAWSIAGGNSYVGRLLKHAGADWHWANDTSAVSLQLDFETVYQIGEQADIWIAPGRTESIADITTIDARFANFKSVETGEVYNYHNRTNAFGMYDYFESGVVKPEIILADLIKIFHPALVPEHKLYYFKKVEM